MRGSVGTVAKVAVDRVPHVLPQLPFRFALHDDVMPDGVRDKAAVDLILGDLEEDFQTKPGFYAGLLEET